MNRPKAVVSQQQNISKQQSENSRPSIPHFKATEPQPVAQTAIGWGAREATFQAEVAPDATWAPAPAGSWWKNKSKKPRPDLDISDAEKMVIDEKPRGKAKVMFIEPNAGGGEAEAGPEEITPGE